MRKKSYIFLVLAIVLCSILHFIDKRDNPLKRYQWGIYNKNGYSINAIDMWSFFEKEYVPDSSNEKVIVAVLDTGIDIEHEDLLHSVWTNKNEIEDGKDTDHNGYIDDIHGWNFYNNDNDVTEKLYSHGTAVAGIIAATDNNSGIKGVASCVNIKILPMKVLSDEGITNNVQDVAKAIKYAEDQGAKICNMSFGTGIYSAEIEKTIRNSNMLFVVSAGNGNGVGKNIEYHPSYPASFPESNIIVVGGAGKDGKLDINSNYGKKTVDIVAPDINIYTTLLNDKYGYVTGTSFSAPFVTGVAAIEFCMHPDASPTFIKKQILAYSLKNTELNGYILDGNMLDGRCIMK